MKRVGVSVKTPIGLLVKTPIGVSVKTPKRIIHLLLLKTYMSFLQKTMFEINQFFFILIIFIKNTLLLFGQVLRFIYHKKGEGK